jgi:hypothetical protein
MPTTIPKPTVAQKEALAFALTEGSKDYPKPAGRLRTRHVSITTINCMKAAGWIVLDKNVRDPADRAVIADNQAAQIAKAKEILADTPERWKQALSQLQCAEQCEELLGYTEYWLTAAGEEAARA